MNDDLTPSGCMPLHESEKHLRLVPTLRDAVSGCVYQRGDLIDRAYNEGMADGWNNCLRAHNEPESPPVWLKTKRKPSRLLWLVIGFFIGVALGAAIASA